MAESVHRPYLWLLAGLAFAAGCLLTAATMSRLSGGRARMERRLADYSALAELDARLAHMETALGTWRERTPGPPAPVSVLATNIFGDIKVEMRETASSNTAPGLVARRVEVTCQDAPFDRAMQLVQRLDGLWPRWVLVHLEIKSTDQAGRGRIMMRFESISSPAAGPVVIPSQHQEPAPAPNRPAAPLPRPTSAESSPVTDRPPGAADARETRPPARDAPAADLVSTNARPARSWLHRIRPEQ